MRRIFDYSFSAQEDTQVRKQKRRKKREKKKERDCVVIYTLKLRKIV